MNEDDPNIKSAEKLKTIEEQGRLWIFALVIPFLAIGGFFMILDQLEDHRNQIDAAERFLPVQAKILESSVKQVSSRSGMSMNSSRKGYIPALRYRYVVDGQGYKRRRYAYFYIRGSEKQAQEIVDSYPVGATVTAYFDPFDHGRSVLNNEMPKNAWIMVAFFTAYAGFLVLIGTVVFFAWRKERAKTKSE